MRRKNNYWQLLRITENFQISLGITYWFTYIHSFKLETNDKIPDFFQHFFNILSIFQNFFNNFSSGHKFFKVFLRRVSSKSKKTWNKFCSDSFLSALRALKGAIFYQKVLYEHFPHWILVLQVITKKTIILVFIL